MVSHFGSATCNWPFPSLRLSDKMANQNLTFHVVFLPESTCHVTKSKSRLFRNSISGSHPNTGILLGQFWVFKVPSSTRNSTSSKRFRFLLRKIRTTQTRYDETLEPIFGSPIIEQVDRSIAGFCHHFCSYILLIENIVSSVSSHKKQHLCSALKTQFVWYHKDLLTQTTLQLSILSSKSNQTRA